MWSVRKLEVIRMMNFLILQKARRLYSLSTSAALQFKSLGYYPFYVFHFDFLVASSVHSAFCSVLYYISRNSWKKSTFFVWKYWKNREADWVKDNWLRLTHTETLVKKKINHPKLSPKPQVVSQRECGDERRGKVQMKEKGRAAWWLTGRADRMPSCCHWHLKGKHTLYCHPFPVCSRVWHIRNKSQIIFFNICAHFD